MPSTGCTHVCRSCEFLVIALRFEACLAMIVDDEMPALNRLNTSRKCVLQQASSLLRNQNIFVGLWVIQHMHADVQ